ncbi:MAG: VanZ family protein [Archangium sp.]|nr:VanZ family protein [Archangium sp.]
MTTTKAARIALGALLLTIYSTLWVIREITNAMRQRGMLIPAVGAAFALAALVVIALLIRNPALRKPKTLLLVAAAGAIYALVVWPMESPEEKLHFIEYGIVGVLWFLSLPDAWSTPKRYVTAALATVASGWLDEGIQALIPTRYYDLRDVGFNALAGLMALTVFTVARALAK